MYLLILFNNTTEMSHLKHLDSRMILDGKLLVCHRAGLGSPLRPVCVELVV